MANESNVVDLKRQRTMIKSACTRIRTYVDSISAVSPSIIAQLEERKSKLEYYWSEYSLIQSRIESLAEAEGADRTSFEEAFYALSAKIRELTSPVLTARSSIFSPSSSSNNDSEVARVRLPKLNLPTFSGKYDEWFPFFDTFNSIIHSNTALSDSQRFQYLRASLTGDASAIINSLEISDANYDVAWSILKQRYDNKRVIVQTHVKAIMELPAMAKENSIDLRKISDGATKHLHALRALKRPTSHWDDLLITILSSKLDSFTLREWKSSLMGNDLPALKQFLEFISHRCQVLEATGKSNGINSKKSDIKTQPSTKRQSACAATVKSKCHFCQGEHAIYYCKDFVALPVVQRISEIRSRKLCVNCLRSSFHTSSKCTSGSCKVCHAKHNTLLHATEVTASSTNNAENNDSSKAANSPSVVATHASGVINSDQVILSTASVYACDNKGSRKPCRRVLLDCGSQANFVSKRLVRNLGLETRPLNVSISGVNGTVAISNQVARVRLESRSSSFTTVIECIVSDQVTDKIPAVSLRRDTFELPRNLQLADPQFHLSADIDLLIGAELFWDLLCVGQIKSSEKHPTLQKTRLGWILAGRLANNTQPNSKIHSLHASITNAQLHDQVSRFWQMDSVSAELNSYTKEEGLCEHHFLENVSQNPEGKCIVKLPVREEVVERLGDSRDIALKRLRNLERRFKHNPELKLQYTKFLDEYLSLGHMRITDPTLTHEPISFYLPHHCVFKTVNDVSKIRVVFDASCRTDSGVSLNDALLVGPVVQQELILILMRFRFFIYTITADIIKMYRQVLIHPSQMSLQRILWRTDPTSEVHAYELTTVTYGTAPASYLATRCLKHLAERYASQFPRGSACVIRDFYVDDLLTGADTIDELKLIKEETVQLLKLGSFELSKWATNCPTLLETSDSDSDLIDIRDDAIDPCILGMHWNQCRDTFQFSCNFETNDLVSKRVILSDIAKLFDPLDILGPVIVIAKLILQELWQLDVHWDESVPQSIHTRWLEFKVQLEVLNQLQIPRCVKPSSYSQIVQLHGFCDASQSAYGACVYVRTRLGPEEYHSSLLCSKSRVAPLKAVSLPRLELSAALLLARLIDRVRESLSSLQLQMHLWSNSTITLNWIASASRRWSVFVANRVGEIQRLTQIESWRHISSVDNPADVLSRGLNPHDLISNAKWWSGPNFLKQDDSQWPSGEFTQLHDNLPEQKRVLATTSSISPCVISTLLDKYSSLNKICRVVSYCLRFTKAHRSYATSEFVSPSELSKALVYICRTIQRRAFPNEFRALAKGDDVGTSSAILSLSPFLDDNGVIRVGGRLKNSDLSFDACHPILLPRKHILTQRIVEQEHVRNMHAGLQATMASVRQRFWPISLRSTVRKSIQGCITCFRAKPIFSEAIMGSLPSARVRASRPFSHCGVDYAGPMLLREGRRRNARSSKAYVSLFVCFATKAIHLELVSSLTSEAFIAAFKRFIARRGKPAHMYSDNETTFVGARKIIKELYDVINDQETQGQIKRFLCEQDIDWSFIPPNAPHFGGLWEAGVKSVKHHLTHRR
ncbi:uncharacterized protein [Mycetomoellerius zeteki]|uniref:uncharacterized protein n=1 Tax=Mycetomoellerius zeteki TaxID=64791 RepID=UPI00084EC5BD|nr:PREDICTED: uncharacterized protein LOC108729356 [Trachymyrmex zeteki]